MQGTDDTKIGQLIIRPYFVRGKMPLQVNNRFPGAVAMLPVCLLHQLVNLPHKVVITFDMGAAGSGKLDENKLFLIVGVFLQEPVNSRYPLNYPLGIINPFHTPPPHPSLPHPILFFSSSFLLPSPSPRAFFLFCARHNSPPGEGGGEKKKKMRGGGGRWGGVGVERIDY